MDPVLALVVTLVTVGIVLVGIGALAYFGQRAAVRPASPRWIRRLAYATAAFGFFGLGYATAAAVTGADIPWLIVIQCVVLLVMSASWLRDVRVSAGQGTWEPPLGTG